MEATVHVPILRDEILAFYRERFPENGEWRFFDGTFGGGGHARAVLEAFPHATLLAFDRDESALQRAQGWIGQYGGRLSVMHRRFSELSSVTSERFHGLLCDLGISSDQLDDRARGFSFRDATTLDARMDQSRGVTALELLNTLPADALRRVFDRGGVRRNSKKLADALVQERPIESGEQFVRICREVLDSPRERRLRGGAPLDTNPATVPLQALRMEVNEELQEIERYLDTLPSLVVPGGVAAFLTFHSLEDELVTKRFREWGRAETSRRFGEVKPALGRHLTQKPILPSADEIAENSRARSARLRVFEFGGGGAWL